MRRRRTTRGRPRNSCKLPQNCTVHGNRNRTFWRQLALRSRLRNGSAIGVQMLSEICAEMNNRSLITPFRDDILDWRGSFAFAFESPVVFPTRIEMTNSSSLLDRSELTAPTRWTHRDSEPSNSVFSWQDWGTTAVELAIPEFFGNIQRASLIRRTRRATASTDISSVLEFAGGIRK